MRAQRGSDITRTRHEALVSPLDPHEAVLPADSGWVRARADRLRHVTGGAFHLVLDAQEYVALTGETPGPYTAGQAFLGPHDQRLAEPIVYLNLRLVADRAAADRVLAHEFAHTVWPSYGHKAVFFDRVQQVLSLLGPTLASHPSFDHLSPTRRRHATRS